MVLSLIAFDSVQKKNPPKSLYTVKFQNSTLQCFHKCCDCWDQFSQIYTNIWPLYRPWPSPNYDGAFATGVACQQGALTLPDTCPPPPPLFLGLACVPINETRFHELAMSFLDFSLWIYPLVLSWFCFKLPEKAFWLSYKNWTKWSNALWFHSIVAGGCLEKKLAHWVFPVLTSYCDLHYKLIALYYIECIIFALYYLAMYDFAW